MLLRSLTARGLSDYELTQTITKHEQTCLKLEKSKIERRRVQARLRIVAAAEMLWNGTEVFRVFRERYVPTNQLRTVLFPSRLLAEDPASSPLPQQAAEYGTWLPDPTSALRKPGDFVLFDAQITSLALSMLHQLIGFKEGCSQLSGSNVTSFVNAANGYHKQRIEQELLSGKTMHLDYFAPFLPSYLDAKNDPRRGILKLRTSLGLQPLPLTHHDSEQMVLEQRANKHFHKLALNACRRCPYSTYIFFPVGIDGLLHHMRMDHPSTFWTGAFHCIG